MSSLAKCCQLMIVVTSHRLPHKSAVAAMPMNLHQLTETSAKPLVKYVMCSLNFCYLVLLATGRKRKRCGECSGCLAIDCGSCKFCLDKRKFGGPGKKKKSCVQKACLNLVSTTQPSRPSQSSRDNCIEKGG